MIQRFFTKLVIFDWTLLNISMRFAGTASTSRVLKTFYPLQTCKSNLSSTIMRSKKEDFSSKEELKKRLTPLQYEVTQNAGTERAFTGEYWNNHKRGTYKCVVCKEDLFSSNTKYESGSGWPSFYDVFDEDKVKLIKDSSYGMVRTEVVCAKCKAHLGHLFDDGPNPTGLRYCMNSASLDFVEDNKK